MAGASVGERLKELRVKRGLTQADVAGSIYSSAYVSTIEAGKRNPSEVALSHFAERLGVSPVELKTGLPSSFEPEASIRLQEGWRFLYEGDYVTAKKLFTAVGRDARRVGHREIQARALVGSGRAEERKGQTGDALALYEQARDLFQEGSALPSWIEAVTGIARCQQSAGDVRGAAHLLETYLLDLESHGLEDPDAVMRICVSLVWPYMELGLSEKAAEVSEKALALETRVNDAEQVARMHLNVARVLLNQGRVDAALASLNKAESIYSTLQWSMELARARLHRGLVLASDDRLDEARTQIDSALKVFREAGFTRGVARALTELAALCRRTRDQAAARAHAHEAIELLAEMDLVPEQALAHREMALASDDEREAAQHFRTAIDLYKRCSELIHAADTHRLLAQLLESSGAAKDACAEYKAGLALIAEVTDRKDP